MSEAIQLAEIFHSTPDIFPWVCLAIICIVTVAQHKRIFAYFDARIDANVAKNGRLIELIEDRTDKQ